LNIEHCLFNVVEFKVFRGEFPSFSSYSYPNFKEARLISKIEETSRKVRMPANPLPGVMALV